ncbi:pectate lyase [Ferruginibacter albus]|uniref:pectate lyase n=1 Tax=Ferruginibacter albus TaxID=2875540 RepID=UPI001CC4434B|nr:pectate lyase [Ferruginibacter albus]UAY50604.1 pectate lyase [Ferruginibacter albus]
MIKRLYILVLVALSLIGYNSSVYAQKTLVVATDGSGDFKSIQAAINSLPDSASSQRIIFIKKGVYKEKLFIEKNFITLKGEEVAATTITYSEARDIFRCTNNDDWGVATINMKGSDIVMENLTVLNTYGFDAKGDSIIACPADSITGKKTVKRNGHQMALRSFNTTRLIVRNCVFRAFGGDTVSPWNVDAGMFYFSNCTMEGGVDFYCPRGWALAENCKFICHSKEAAIWHDGSKNKSSKTVLINCSFSGDDGFKLGRYHRDAQFYLINCTFPSNMADSDIYQRAANPPNVIQWGKRVFYNNCHRIGGDYAWFKNNFPDSLGVNDINVPWVYDYKWNPKPDGRNTFEPRNLDDTDRIADNMLLYQRENGGWPKHFQELNVDYTKDLAAEQKDELQKGYEAGLDATIDNDATTKEIRYLVKVYNRTGNSKYLRAAQHGIDYLLKAQYANGGWPQFYPDSSSYRNEITYNDNAMVNALNILQDVVDGANGFNAIDAEYISLCKPAVERGISCILKTQIKQKGVLTVWCAQYNARTLQPAKARTFELASLSGAESVGIVRFLMRVKTPSREIIESVTDAVNWFKKTKIAGYKFVEIKAPKEQTGRDKILVPDSTSTIWARFYGLDDNQPFFCGRDGVRKKTLAEIENERRAGYQWYGTWPENLVNKEYPKWLKALQLSSAKEKMAKNK